MLPDGSKVPVERSLKLRSRIRNIVKAKYEDWLEYRARRRVFDMKVNFSVDEYKDSMRAVADGVAAGDFSWGGDAWKHSFTQLPGQIKMLSLLAADADELLISQQQEPQRISDTDMLQHYRDEHVGVLLGQALLDIRRSDPNFLAAPVRGLDE